MLFPFPFLTPSYFELYCISVFFFKLQNQCLMFIFRGINKGKALSAEMKTTSHKVLREWINHPQSNPWLVMELWENWLKPPNPIKSLLGKWLTFCGLINNFLQWICEWLIIITSWHGRLEVAGRLLFLHFYRTCETLSWGQKVINLIPPWCIIIHITAMFHFSLNLNYSNCTKCHCMRRIN